jgi:hypothetical protein
MQVPSPPISQPSLEGVSVLNVKGGLTTAVTSRSIMIVVSEHVYQCLQVLLRLPYQAPSSYRLLLPITQSTPSPPDAVLGHKMSLPASALDAQDGMSVRSTEVENQFNDFPENDRKSAVPQDDDANVHNIMATIGDAVPAYNFLSWLDGDDPDALAMEDHFFLLGEVDLSDDEEEVDEFSSQSCDSNPPIISSSPRFLFLYMKLIAKIQYQNTFTTTNEKISSTLRWMPICMMHMRRSCITLKTQLSSRAF